MERAGEHVDKARIKRTLDAMIRRREQHLLAGASRSRQRPEALERLKFWLGIPNHYYDSEWDAASPASGRVGDEGFDTLLDVVSSGEWSVDSGSAEERGSDYEATRASRSGSGNADGYESRTTRRDKGSARSSAGRSSVREGSRGPGSAQSGDPWSASGGAGSDRRGVAPSGEDFSSELEW